MFRLTANDSSIQRVAERTTAESLFSSLRHLPRARWLPEMLAGVTLLAIAVPEQIATAQLADVPAFLALLGFIVATVIFAMLGSNPVLSVGADSTIAPLFAVALIRLALPNSPHYLALVALTAVMSGVMVAVIGVIRFGWLADFLSAPIVTGFMVGIGLTIIVHQLPHALGIADVGGTFVHRLDVIFSSFSHVQSWPVILAVATAAMVVLGEKLMPRSPMALVAIVAATVATVAGSLRHHGVATLGTVHIVTPHWRLSGFTWHEALVVLTTATTIALVILSQSAATSRDVADEMAVEDSINRDLIAIGAANVVSGLVGSLPVNASPARTGVVRLAKGTTQLVGLVAAGGTLLSGLAAPLMRNVPLAALAGILFYVAGRLIKVRTLRQILRVDRYEFALALVTALAVVLIGVQEGIGVAVLLAVLDQTRRNARPRTVLMGRRPNSTSWESLGHEGAVPVDRVTVVLFSAPLFFANAALFRDEMHGALKRFPETRHVVIDGAAMSDIDFTGVKALTSVVDDLARDHIDVVIARASDKIIHTLSRAPSHSLREVRTFTTVDEAVRAISG